MTIDRPMLRYGVFLFLAATAVFLFSQSASAQWTQPSGSSNVYKTDTNGNVAIGTSSPNQKLHVETSGTSGLTGVANRGILITDAVGPRLVLEDSSQGTDAKVWVLRNEAGKISFNALTDL